MKAQILRRSSKGSCENKVKLWAASMISGEVKELFPSNTRASKESLYASSSLTERRNENICEGNNAWRRKDLLSIGGDPIRRH